MAHPSSLARDAQALNLVLVAALRAHATFGKPEMAIGSSCDIPWTTVGGGDRELRNAPTWSDAPDLVGITLDKPQVAIGASGDLSEPAVGSGERKLGDTPACGDAPDPALVLRKPEVAIGTLRDPERSMRDPKGRAMKWKAERGHDPAWSDASNLVAAAARLTFDKPEVPIGSSRDALWIGSALQRKLGNGPAGGDASDLASLLGKPEITIGSSRDALYLAARWKGKCGERSSRRMRNKEPRETTDEEENHDSSDDHAS